MYRRRILTGQRLRSAGRIRDFLAVVVPPSGGLILSPTFLGGFEPKSTGLPEKAVATLLDLSDSGGVALSPWAAIAVTCHPTCLPNEISDER